MRRPFLEYFSLLPSYLPLLVMQKSMWVSLLQTIWKKINEIQFIESIISFILSLVKLQNDSNFKELTLASFPFSAYILPISLSVRPWVSGMNKNAQTAEQKIAMAGITNVYWRPYVSFVSSAVFTAINSTEFTSTKIVLCPKVLL